MALSRWRIARLASALAFVASIAIGVGVGLVLTVGEAIEDKFKAGKRHAVKQTPDRS